MLFGLCSGPFIGRGLYSREFVMGFTTETIVNAFCDTCGEFDLDDEVCHSETQAIKYAKNGGWKYENGVLTCAECLFTLEDE